MTIEAQSETFFNIFSAVRDNREEREKMLSILRLEPTRRKIAINILVTEMRLKQAPTDFVEAWDALQDDGLAEQAKRIIEDLDDSSVAAPARLALALGIVVLAAGVIIGIVRFLKW